MIPKLAILVSIVGGVLMGLFLEGMLQLYDVSGLNGFTVLAGLCAVGTLAAVIMVVHNEIYPK